MSVIRLDAACLAITVVASTYAADFPARPVRIVVPIGAGSSMDIVGRLLGQKLAETWGQTVIVDNRAGAGGILGYTPHPEATPYRPSVDRLFESALTGWTKPLVAVLLTGMGRDGAKGLRALRDAGHFTIAQDEATSALYGMPKAAAQLDAAREILPLPRIAPRIVDKIRTLLP